MTPRSTDSTDANDTAAFLRRGDSQRTALLLLDWQVDVCGRGGAMVSQEDEVLARFQAAREEAGRVLTAARAAGAHVVHVVHAFEPGYPELAPGRPTAMARTMVSRGAFVVGSPGAAVVPEVAPAPGEAVLRKTSISPFETTDLATHLWRRSIDTVLLAGVVTHYVVLATALAAGDRGLRVVVASHACASGSVDRHIAALEIMKPLVALVGPIPA